MLDKVLAQAQRDFPRHLERLQHYIRNPAISADNTGHNELGKIIADEIKALGGTAEVVQGVDFPIIYGKFDVGAARTVLLHSMYDVTPAKEPGWVVPPFEGRRMEYGELGDCIVARGTEDTLGPLSMLVNVIDAYRAAGEKLPVNLIIVFEASETGSRSIGPFVAAHREELKKAEVCYWPFHMGRSDGSHIAFLRAKGLITMKITCKGGAWGGPIESEVVGVHSTWVANPAHRLIAALASLKTPEDGIAVEGFYDECIPPTPEDEALIKDLVTKVDAKRTLADLGVARFKQDTLEAALRARCFESEFNISGLKCGYAEETGYKVIVPNEATAHLDIRTMEGMTVDGIVGKLRKHFDKHGFPEVQIQLLSGYIGGGSPPSDWAVKELLATYKECGIEPEVWPRDPPAIHAKLWNDLGLSWIATCPGHSNRRHAANEYIQVKGYKQAIEFGARLLWRLGQAKGRG